METELRQLFRDRSEGAPALTDPPLPVIRRARRRRFVNAAGGAAAVAAVVIVTVVAVGSRQSGVVPPVLTQTPSPQPSGTQSFDGVIQGWRLAPQTTLDGEGLERDLRAGLEQVAPGCSTKQVGASTKTDLDFTVGHLPAGLKLSNGGQPVKWVCGSIGLSVFRTYNFEDVARQGVAMLTVERALMDKRIFGIDVPAERVAACTVRGFKAICMHPEDDVTGRGTTIIFTIEDDSLDPFATRIYVQGDEIPYAEVLKIAESIR